MKTFKELKEGDIIYSAVYSYSKLDVHKNTVIGFCFAWGMFEIKTDKRTFTLTPSESEDSKYLRKQNSLIVSTDLETLNIAIQQQVLNILRERESYLNEIKTQIEVINNTYKYYISSKFK